jgi:uncharacterized phage protein gp47/JayE
MAVTTPTFQQMLSRAWNTVSAKTGLSNDSESGFAINILRIFCQELMLLWEELAFLDTQSSISSATGANLDSIGEFFGVIRSSAVTASTLGSSYSVNFTNNGASVVTVPINTRVWVSSNPSISYYTVSNATIPPGQVVFVDVKAASPGSAFNVGANQIDSSSVGLASVTVTNNLPITSGADLESDDNFRVRIQQQIYVREGNNLTALRNAVMSVPGIRDVQISNLARGTGTVDVMLYGYDTTLSDATVARCQQVLDDTVAGGISAIAKAPTLSYVDVSVQVILVPNGNMANVVNAISAMVRGYIDNLPIENGTGQGTLVYSELAARVQQASSDINSTTVSLTIDNVPALKSNQSAAVGSRFVSRAITVA